MKNVGFQMSDYVFELTPEQYLYKGDANKCYFVIHKCKLPGKNANLYLIGDAFLKHFYSVYDFDQDQLSLGINVHSKDKVKMYKPGQLPQTATDKKEEPAKTDSSAPAAASHVETSEVTQEV